MEKDLFDLSAELEAVGDILHLAMAQLEEGSTYGRDTVRNGIFGVTRYIEYIMAELDRIDNERMKKQ